MKTRRLLKMFKKFRYFILSLIISLTLIIPSYSYARVTVMIDDLGEVSGSAAYPRYTTLNQIVAAVGATDTTVICNTSITANTVNVPANLTLAFNAAGLLTVNAGQTVTFAAQVEASPTQQIFAGVGNVDFVRGSRIYSGWFNSFGEAVAEVSDDEIVLLISVSDTLIAPVTIPAGIYAEWGFGSVITLDAFNLTINAPTKIGLHQAFYEDGIGVVSFGVGTVNEFCPEWWGIDGIADDVEIQKAINCVTASLSSKWGGTNATRYQGGGAVLLSQWYNTTSTITSYESIEWRGTGRNTCGLNFTGSGDAILELSQTAIDANFDRMNIYLHDFGIEGGGKTNIGIYSNSDYGLQSSVIERLAIDNCQVGMRLEGGWINKIRDNDITNCIVGIAGLVLDAATGFNANIFDNNRIQTFTRHGIFITGRNNILRNNVVQFDAYTGADSAPTNIATHTFPVGIEVYGKDVTTLLLLPTRSDANHLYDNWFEDINDGISTGTGIYLDNVDLTSSQSLNRNTQIGPSNHFVNSVDRPIVINDAYNTLIQENNYMTLTSAITLNVNSQRTIINESMFSAPATYIVDNSIGAFTLNAYVGSPIPRKIVANARFDVTSKTADYVLTVADSGNTFDNNAAGGLITFSLPAMSQGLEYIICRRTAQLVRVDPNGAETILGGGVGKYLEIQSTGLVHLKTLGTGQWYVYTSNGTIAFEP